MTGNRMSAMKQLGLGLNLSTKKTCKREFLEEMERVVPATFAGGVRTQGGHRNLGTHRCASNAIRYPLLELC